jgi:hypothetical protein
MAYDNNLMTPRNDSGKKTPIQHWKQQRLHVEQQHTRFLG